MKKLICLLLVCTMLLGAASAVWADEPFDISYIKNPDWSNMYELSVNNDKDCAFITSFASVADRSFSHPDESDIYYSYFEHDMLVLNYNESTRYPVFRLWIRLATQTGYKDITSVTFTFDGKSYTFSDISNSDWYTIPEKGGYSQQVLIKFGTENKQYLDAMYNYAERWVQAGFPDSYSVTMTLHGKTDITVKLGYFFLMDFIELYFAMDGCHGFQHLGKAFASPMRIG